MKIPAALFCLSLHLAGAEFPTPYNSELDKTSQPMPAEEAAAKMQLPPGLKATVFAAEPDVQNPIGLSWDSRGRLWIAENYTYAERSLRFDLKLRDRIVIFADRDGDGRADERKVFTDDVQMLTSVEVGHGGVWALCLPNLVFIPDRNGDDIPDGPAEVMLTGFAAPQENYHNIANGLRFGPDGWLYGRCGASGAADVSLPGAPAEERIPVRGGMWRYHPVRKVFEAITSGHTNNWGHDWDANGELFYVNTVNGHLWHGITGAHFMRAHTVDPNPRAYALIDQHADHWHFDTGKSWQDSRAGAANAFGGGHSHIGTMIYQGDDWPAEYRGHLFTLNQHGKRANQEILERRGSGYVGKHGADTLIMADPFFVGIDLATGPDGGVFVLDWSDTGECHESTGVHRTSGRIYKIARHTGSGAGAPPAVSPPGASPGDLRKLDVPALVKLQSHPNDWFARQSRLELANRTDPAAAVPLLRDLFTNSSETHSKLRALWTLSALGATDAVFLRTQLNHADEHVRAWAVRLISDDWPLDTLMSVRPTWRADFTAAEKPAAAWTQDFARLAREDSSALVRLALASALQRLPIAQRAAVAASLVAHAEDESDHNLPLLVWYGLIPVGDVDPGALVKVAANCELPQTRRYIARRLAEDLEKNPQPLNDLLSLSRVEKNAAFATEIFGGVAEALAGWRKAAQPAAWKALAAHYQDRPEEPLHTLVRELSVVFGDGRALEEVKRVAMDKKADLSQRKAALQTLIDSRPPDLRAICEPLLSERFLNSVAARGLATIDDPAIGPKLVGAYKQFHQTERGQLLATLVTRASFVAPLLEAIAAGKIPRADLTPFHARQILSLNDPVLQKRLAETWGELRESAADKQQLMAKWKQRLAPATLAAADKSAGRETFTAVCSACHRLYGEGGAVGPDLTGTGRANLDYLLENIADPSAQVSADFRLTILNLKDGRVLNGFVTAKTDRTLTLRTMTEQLTVERSEITSSQELPQSLMPEGLLQALSDTQVRDLLAYLMHPTQVPLPAATR